MRYLLISIAALCLSACGASMQRNEAPEVAGIELEAGEPVDRAYMPLLDSWRRVDDTHLVLFESRSKGYLVELERPIIDTGITEIVIGVRQTGHFLTTHDYIVIDGWPHDIKTIRPLSPEQSRKLS